MGVNLNKQGHNVSLKKESLNKGTKISLQKEEVSGVAGSVDFGSAGAAGSVQGEAQAEKESKKQWLWIPAAVVGILIAAFVIGSGIAKIKDENSIMVSNDSVDKKTDESVRNGTDENDKSETDESVKIGTDGNDMAEMDGTGKTETDLQEAAEPEQDNTMENGSEAGEGESVMTDVIPGMSADDEAIHNYEVIVADVTWSEAFEDCISRGGYLCRINSDEENEIIKELLMNQKVKGVVYLGGMREDNSTEYHWVDHNMEPFDDVINEGDYLRYWYDGEPSYADDVDGIEITEKYMALIYRSATKEWVWNDINDDVLSLSPDYYSGKLAYICEYE